MVEIDEEMSELLDKQLWQPMNKRVTAKVGGNRKCAMKIKKKKRLPVKKIFNDKKDFIRLRKYNDKENRFDRKDKHST